MPLDADTIDAVGQLSDPLGVLSIYVDASPDTASRNAGHLDAPLRAELKALEERVKEEGPRERWQALRRRLDELGSDLERLIDIRESGRGRALFAPLGEGEVVHVASGVPFPHAVRLEETALVRPLIEAAAADPPTGVVTLAKGGVRIFDRRGGAIEEVLDERFEQQAEDMGNETGGPRSDAGYSSSAGKSIPQQDYYENIVAEEQRNFLRSVAERLGRLIGRNGWSSLVVAGDERLAGTLQHALPGNARISVLRVDHQLDSQSPYELWEVIAEEVAAAREGEQVALVTRARDGALSTNGRGSLGLADTLAALAEGRVETLILERARAFPGSVGPDGQLSAPADVPLGVEAAEQTHEPDIGERIVEQALATSAHVVPVDGRAAEELAEHDGVAAILRW
jgi:hypothetical protein